MIKLSLTNLISIFMYLSINSLFAVVGGDIVNDNRVARLSKCESKINHQTGGSRGCSDIRLATGSFISESRILTAGHFAAHFKFNSNSHLLKIVVSGKEALLKYNEDFHIDINKSYYNYEKRIRNNSSLTLPSIETCGEDIATIVLSQSGKQKVKIKNYFEVETMKKTRYDFSVEMYGYGNNIFEIYNERQANLSSTLNWILSLGEADRKTWIKNKKIDDKLRVGSNILKPSCETLPEADPRFIVDTIKSKMGDNDYYNSFMASGDSGGPAVMNNKIIGVFCSINSFHLNEEVNFINLITPTYSEKLKSFWINK